jgi:methionyl aminopeptidase
MAIIIKSKREIGLIKEAGELLASTLKFLKLHTVVGISTYELDKLAGEYILAHGGIPSSKGYEGFPGNICISVNDTLIHGIPSKKIILKEGDIVSYDLLVTLHGYTADGARTYGVGKISKEAERLIETTKEAFFAGVREVKPKAHIGDISEAIETVVHKANYTCTADYTGHGVGREVHEDPYVPNVGKRGNGPRLEEGMTIAIEPMVNEGKVDLVTMDDGWTVKTKDGKLSCHYENTVVVTSNGYEIVTLMDDEEDLNG